MSVQLSANFDNRDRADLALSRLRSRGIAFHANVRAQGARPDEAPLSHYCANLLFPYQPVNLSTSDAVTGDHVLGMRAILPFETMGNTGSGRGGEVKLRLSVSPQERDAARAILLNSGGYHIV